MKKTTIEVYIVTPDEGGEDTAKVLQRMLDAGWTPSTLVGADGVRIVEHLDDPKTDPKADPIKWQHEAIEAVMKSYT